jgi:hypothetical protein
VPRYDEIYRNLAERAVEQGGVDLRSLFRQAETAGMSAARFQERLLQDLEEGGPIFGKFFRSLGGAARSATAAAMRQGEFAGDVERFTGLANTVGSIIDTADPASLQQLEDELGDSVALTWVAELVNTCHRCLPLHGTTRTLAQWQELGLHPETIHADWNSECKCRLIRSEQAASQSDLVAPLKRNKVKSPTGLKGSRRTARAVSQVDLEKSIAARNEALESIEGRRTLRLLGTSGVGSDE